MLPPHEHASAMLHDGSIHPRPSSLAPIPRRRSCGGAGRGRRAADDSYLRLVTGTPRIRHFSGTMIFGVSVALLFGIKRQAIGATFSIGQKPSLAIIGEEFGIGEPAKLRMQAVPVMTTTPPATSRSELSAGFVF